MCRVYLLTAHFNYLVTNVDLEKNISCIISSKHKRKIVESHKLGEDLLGAGNRHAAARTMLGLLFREIDSVFH